MKLIKWAPLQWNLMKNWLWGQEYALQTTINETCMITYFQKLYIERNKIKPHPYLSVRKVRYEIFKKLISWSLYSV